MCTLCPLTTRGGGGCCMGGAQASRLPGDAKLCG